MIKGGYLKTKQFTAHIENAGRIAGLILFFMLMILPLFWLIMTSIKPMEEVYTFPIRYFPSRIDLTGFKRVLSVFNFAVYFRNSLLVGLFASCLSVFMNALAGYGLSRIKSPKMLGRILLVIYFNQMIPGFISLLPFYTMVSKLRMGDSLIALTFLYGISAGGFGTLMAKSFFDRIPPTLEEAALIDGCSPITALFRVVLPVTLPALAALFCMTFVNVWNELYLAVLLISDGRKYTIPVALNTFISKSGFTWDVMSAGLVLALLPTLVLFAAGQKWIVSGLTEGGEKG